MGPAAEKEESQKFIVFLAMMGFVALLVVPAFDYRSPGLAGCLPIIVFIPALLWRLVDEDSLLRKNLRGYTEYIDKVRYRLVPYVWSAPESPDLPI